MGVIYNFLEHEAAGQMSRGVFQMLEEEKKTKAGPEWSSSFH